MKNVFIFHGTNNGPKGNWFPWMKNELEKLNCKVYVPQFPLSKNYPIGWNELQGWKEAFKQYKKYVDKNTVIIAHSKGCIFTYHLLSELKRIYSVFLIAPWFKYHWYDKNKPVSTFHVEPFHWELYKNKAQNFEVFQSTNDIIEVDEGKKIASDLNGKLIIVKNAGHFNIAYSQKFKKFPLLLNHIKKVL